MQHADAQQVKFGTAVHMPFDQFEPVDLAFDLAALLHAVVNAARTAGKSASSPAAKRRISTTEHVRACANQ